MGIFIAIGVPAMSSLSKSGGFNQSVIQLTGLLDVARSSAIAKNTYVWVGIGEDVAEDGLAVTAIASNTGRGSAFSTTDIRPIVPPVTLKNLSLGHNLSQGIADKETDGVEHLSDASGEYLGSLIPPDPSAIREVRAARSAMSTSGVVPAKLLAL